MEEQQRVKFKNQHLKFTLRHDEETIHNCIDLIGYSGREAVELSQRRLSETQRALNRGEIKPNFGNGSDHVFKIIAHAGKHSKHGAVLKYKIESLLDDTDYECYKDMDNGVFLVRMIKGKQ